MKTTKKKTIAIASIVLACAAATTLALSMAFASQSFFSEPIKNSELFDTGKYFQPGDASILKRSDVTVANGTKKTVDNAYGNGVFVTSTNNSASDGATNCTVTATYENAGRLVDKDTGKSTPVDLKTVIKPTSTINNTTEWWWEAFQGMKPDNKFHIFFSDHYDGGMTIANATEWTQDWYFIDHDTGKTITLDGDMWIYQASLNMGEGFACDDVEEAYTSTTMPNRNDQASSSYKSVWSKIKSSSYRCVIPGSNVYEMRDSDTKFRGFVGASDWTEYTTASGGTDVFKWAEPVEDSTLTGITISGYNGNQVIKGSHNWAAGSLKLSLSNANKITVYNYSVADNQFPKTSKDFKSTGIAYDKSNGRYSDEARIELQGLKFYVQYFGPLTGIVPDPPTKSVSTTSDPTGATARVGDDVSYTVTQQVGKWGGSMSYGTTYDSLVFKDDVPVGLTYKANSFRVQDQSGRTITSSAGSLSYTVDGNGRGHLTYTFKGSYLAKTLAYDGGNLTFSFKCTIDTPVEAESYVNGATTIFNNDYELDSNEVETVPVSQVVVEKVSDELYNWTYHLTTYSRAGAVYSLYSDAACTKDAYDVIDKATHAVTTRYEQIVAYGTSGSESAGDGQSVLVNPGGTSTSATQPGVVEQSPWRVRSTVVWLNMGKTYYLKETTASEGYALDTVVYQIDGSDNATFSVAKGNRIPFNQDADKYNGATTVTSTEPPVEDPISIFKQDATYRALSATNTNPLCRQYLSDATNLLSRQRKQQIPQGDASLDGAQYRVTYYDGYYATASAAASSGALQRTWTMTTATDATYGQGYAHLDVAHLVAGSGGLYYNAANAVTQAEATVPLGTIVVTEVRASDGYTLKNADLNDVYTYVIQVKKINDTTTAANFVGQNYMSGTLDLNMNSRGELDAYNVVQRSDAWALKGDWAWRVMQEGYDLGHEWDMIYDRRVAATNPNPTSTVAGATFEFYNRSTYPVISPTDGKTIVPSGGKSASFERDRYTYHEDEDTARNCIHEWRALNAASDVAQRVYRIVTDDLG